MATALEIAQRVALRVGLDQPQALFGASGRTEEELRQALIEASDKILHAHDWQALLTVATQAGDGTTTEFALPSDYLRMPKDSKLYSSRWEWALQRIDPNDWLNLDVRDYEITTGVWTIYGDNVVHRPAPQASETIRFFYVSNKHIVDDAQVTKAEFTEDTDEFRLDDRALELAAIAEFRKTKGMDYQDEMFDATRAISRAITRDQGAKVIKQRSRQSREVGEIAYPITVTP